MAGYNQDYKNIGTQFLEHYYKTFQQDRSQLRQLYGADSILSWQDVRSEPICGTDNIMNKLIGLPFKTVEHTSAHPFSQPMADGGILIAVSGDLKIDGDNPLKFSQTFILRNVSNTWYISNE